MAIIRAKRIEKPLPHLISSMSFEDMDAVRRGFLSMCGIDSYAAGSACEPHFHDCQEYWFILDGKGSARVGEIEEQVEPGDVVLTPTGTEHQFTAVTDASVLWCYGELKGQQRLGHLQSDQDEPSTAAEPTIPTPIIRHRYLESIPPHIHVDHALQPADMDAIKEGFLTMCGWDYYAKGSQCDLHSHDCDEYWFILYGKGIARVGNEQGEVGHGDAVFTPMATKHQFTALTDNVCMLWMYGELKGRKRVGHVHEQ